MSLKGHLYFGHTVLCECNRRTLHGCIFRIMIAPLSSMPPALAFVTFGLILGRKMPVCACVFIYIKLLFYWHSDFLIRDALVFLWQNVITERELNKCQEEAIYRELDFCEVVKRVCAFLIFMCIFSVTYTTCYSLIHNVPKSFIVFRGRDLEGNWITGTVYRVPQFVSVILSMILVTPELYMCHSIHQWANPLVSSYLNVLSGMRPGYKRWVTGMVTCVSCPWLRPHLLCFLVAMGWAAFLHHVFSASEPTIDWALQLWAKINFWMLGILSNNRKVSNILLIV